MARKRRRKKNPKGNRPALGAFIGSMVGVAPSWMLRFAGIKEPFWPVWVAGSMIGGAVGGYVGAAPQHKRRSALGGGVGGVVGPLGAALGGYIAGQVEPDDRLPAAVVAGAAVTVGGGIGYAVYRKRKQQLERPSLEPDRPPREDNWEALVDLDAAMPVAADFPMGWTEEGPGSAGRQDFSDDPEAGPDYYFAYQVLELNAPSDACTPDPCNWVAVWSGATEYRSISSGWSPTQTRQEAYAEIEDMRRDLLR